MSFKDCGGERRLQREGAVQLAREDCGRETEGCVASEDTAARERPRQESTVVREGTAAGEGPAAREVRGDCGESTAREHSKVTDSVTESVTEPLLRNLFSVTLTP